MAIRTQAACSDLTGINLSARWLLLLPSMSSSHNYIQYLPEIACIIAFPVSAFNTNIRIKNYPKLRPGKSMDRPVLSLRSHHLIDGVPDSIRCLPAHLLGGMGVGVQREARRVVAQRVGEGLHIRTVLEGQCGERMSEVSRCQVRGKNYPLSRVSAISSR